MKTKTRANYRFPLEATNEWKQHLQSKGYCVIANTLNVDEIETSKVLIIEDLERLKIKLPVHGLVPEISQSAGAWKIRGNPNIKKAFEHIWQDSELITSMDCVLGDGFVFDVESHFFAKYTKTFTTAFGSL